MDQSEKTETAGPAVTSVTVTTKPRESYFRLLLRANGGWFWLVFRMVSGIMVPMWAVTRPPHIPALDAGIGSLIGANIVGMFAQVTKLQLKESMDNFGALLQVLQEFVARTTRRHEISAEQVEPTDPNAN